MNFIQKQLQIFVEEQKNSQQICQTIFHYFHEQHLSNEKQKELLANCLYHILVFYTTNSTQQIKSHQFLNLIQFYITLLHQTDYSFELLFQLLLMQKLSIQSKYYLVFIFKALYEKKKEYLIQQSNKQLFKSMKEVMYELIFHSHSSKIQQLLIPIHLEIIQHESQERREEIFNEYSELVLQSTDLLFILNEYDEMKSIQFEYLIKILHSLTIQFTNSNSSNNSSTLNQLNKTNEIHLMTSFEEKQSILINEISKRIPFVSSNEQRKLFHLICVYSQSSYSFKKDMIKKLLEQMILSLIESEKDLSKFFYSQLHYLCDHPLISTVIKLLFEYHLVTPEELCNSQSITKHSSIEQFFCSARIFENEQFIEIDLEENELLEVLSTEIHRFSETKDNVHYLKIISILDLLIYSPRLIFNERIKTYELFEELLSFPSQLYHNYSQLGIIIKCCVRLFGYDSILMITNYLAENEMNVNENERQLNSTIEWNKMFTIEYMHCPVYKESPLFERNEHNILMIDCLLKCNKQMDNYKRIIEENYVIPLLASQQTVTSVMNIMITHYKEDLFQLFPMIIHQFWNIQNPSLHHSLLLMILTLINEYGIESIINQLQSFSITELKIESFEYQSIASTSLSEIIECDWNFFVDSYLLRDITEDIFHQSNDNQSNHWKKEIIALIIEMIKKEYIMDPIVLSKSFNCILLEYPEYISLFLTSLQFQEELLEETLLLSFLSILQSPSQLSSKSTGNKQSFLHQLLTLFSYFLSNVIIEGKRIFLVVLDELFNGYSSQYKTMLLKLLNEVTQWNTDWNKLRAVGCIVLNAIQLKGDGEKERIQWLLSEEIWKKDDIDSLTENQFSQIYSLIMKNEF